MKQEPNYVATCSAWAAVTFWRVFLFFLIIPLIIMIFDIIGKKHITIEFYDDYIIQRKGVFSKSEKRSAFLGVAGVSVEQTLWQRMFHYGDIQVDAVGKWDIQTENIVNPEGLKNYLESRLVKREQVTNVFAN